MQTIKIEIEDNIYKKIVDSGINIQENIKDMLYDLVDDGYPAISFEEAKKRVKDAVEEYRSGKGEYLSPQEYEKEMSNFLETL